MLKTQKEAHDLYIRGYSQQQIADELKISQPTISRLIGKKQRASLHEIGKQTTDEFLDAYTRAKLFFDQLLVEIDKIDSDDPDFKLKKINQAAVLMEKSLYLASQGRYMQFVQYTNEIVESHELVSETEQPKQIDDKRGSHYQ